MIYYSDLYRKLSRVHKPGMEYEVLNELSDTNPVRSDSTCKKYTRFLFEFDNMSIDNQRKVMDMQKDILTRATFSGSKSVHMIVQFSDECNEFCKRWYKNIWRWLEINYFPGSDLKCSNPSRLTRAPGVKRSDTGKVQKLLFESRSNFISKDNSIMEKLKESEKKWILNEKELEEEKMRRSIVSKFLSGNSLDGMCKTYTTVKRYLDTSFPRIRGNGNSSTWLFAAICTCLKYKDNVSLNEVIEKAKSEKWTDKELSRTIESAKSKID